MNIINIHTRTVQYRILTAIQSIFEIAATLLAKKFEVKQHLRFLVALSPLFPFQVLSIHRKF